MILILKNCFYIFFKNNIYFCLVFFNLIICYDSIIPWLILFITMKININNIIIVTIIIIIINFTWII